jgi:hypothetical protein
MRRGPPLTLSWRPLTMNEVYSPTRRANKVADWLEITALARGVSLGGDALHKMGQGFGFKATDVDLGLTTIGRRAALLGKAYPFVTGAGIAARADAWKFAWTAMLLMSPESPTRSSIDLAEAAAHLERITAEALKRLFGHGTSSVRFAWPSEDGRPPEFPDAVRWLANLMRVPVGTAYRPPYAKDGGVDVVAWRSFPDGRSGFPVLLAQVTLEKDYVHKATDVDVRVWSGWLALDHDPATALAIPDVVASGEDWNSLAARTVVLDRIRLSSLLDGSESDQNSLAGVGAWTKLQVASIQEPM